MTASPGQQLCPIMPEVYRNRVFSSPECKQQHNAHMQATRAAASPESAACALPRQPNLRRLLQQYGAERLHTRGASGQPDLQLLRLPFRGRQRKAIGHWGLPKIQHVRLPSANSTLHSSLCGLPGLPNRQHVRLPNANKTLCRCGLPGLPSLMHNGLHRGTLPHPRGPWPEVTLQVRDTWTRAYLSCSTSFCCRKGKLLHWPKRLGQHKQ